MARLKPIPFKFKPLAGEPYAFTSDASVNDGTGEFALTIPGELEDAANDVLRSHNDVYRVNMDRPRTHLRVTGATLEACKNFINHAGNDYVACEVTKELVIVYGVFNRVCYIKDEAGILYPNGRYVADYDKNIKAGNLNWMGELNGSSEAAPYYQIGFIARVVQMTTYKRPSGVRRVFERHIEDDDETWAGRLNAFIGLSLDYRPMDRMQRIPYSDEAAKFFCEVMQTMCQLADRISGFFDDKERLMLAIENQTGLLAFAPATTT